MSMLTITKNQEGSKLNVTVIGRVDTNTAPQLDNDISQSLDGITELVLDFAQTEYVSSAGLRVLLALYKTMNAKQGKLVLCKVNHTITDMFIATGLIDFFEIV